MKPSNLIGEHGSRSKCYVIIDKVTGVNYLAVQTMGLRDSSNGIAITPLLNQEGKPIVELN